VSRYEHKMRTCPYMSQIEYGGRSVKHKTFVLHSISLVQATWFDRGTTYPQPLPCRMETQLWPYVPNPTHHSRGELTLPRKNPKKKPPRHLVTAFRQQYPWVAFKAKPNSDLSAPRRQPSAAWSLRNAASPNLSYGRHDRAEEPILQSQIPPRSQQGSDPAALRDKASATNSMYSNCSLPIVPLWQYDDVSYCIHMVQVLENAEYQQDSSHLFGLAEFSSEKYYGVSTRINDYGTTFSVFFVQRP